MMRISDFVPTLREALGAHMNQLLADLIEQGQAARQRLVNHMVQREDWARADAEAAVAAAFDPPPLRSPAVSPAA